MLEDSSTSFTYLPGLAGISAVVSTHGTDCGLSDAILEMPVIRSPSVASAVQAARDASSRVSTFDGLGTIATCPKLTIAWTESTGTHQNALRGTSI